MTPEKNEMTVIGWDLGGAHLKAARAEQGRIVGTVQIACPLWQGLDKLDAAFAEADKALGAASLHAVTMTGELSDIFSNRAEGISRLCEAASKRLAGRIRIYAGRDGWLDVEAAPGKTDSVASANWHATAALLARLRMDSLFVDMGSTTTDIIPVIDGRISARGYSDAERLATGELVYTGASRTFLMAVARQVPFRGTPTPLMNEYFASMADVHRIRGELPEDADLHPAADSREKSSVASAARLARMIGRDADEAAAWEWRSLADFFAEAQLQSIHNAALQALSACRLPDKAPVIAVGAGRFVVEKLAQRLGRPCERWEKIVPAAPELGAKVSDCAPAAAVALLLSYDQGSPP